MTKSQKDNLKQLVGTVARVNLDNDIPKLSLTAIGIVSYLGAYGEDRNIKVAKALGITSANYYAACQNLIRGGLVSTHRDGAVVTSQLTDYGERVASILTNQ